MALKDNYVTITQAAKQLGVTRQTISRWVAKSDVPAEKIGRETLINKKNLNKYRLLKLSNNAAGSIIELWESIATDYFREKGRLKEGEKVSIISRDDGLFKYDISFSVKESLEIKERLRPVLAGFLQGFSIGVTEIKQQGKKETKRQGGKKSK